MTTNIEMHGRVGFIHHQLSEKCQKLVAPKECQPHWFLPVAPVEGRIAAAMVRGGKI